MGNNNSHILDDVKVYEKKKLCNLIQIVQTLNINHITRLLVENRVLRKLKNIKKTITKYKRLDRAGSTIILFGSILTPALISIQHFSTETLFWVTFSTSLVTSITQAFLNTFDIKKKVLISMKAYNKLDTETYSFFELSHNYKIYDNYNDAHKTFFENIEIILKEYSEDKINTEEDQFNHKLERDNKVTNESRISVKEIKDPILASPRGDSVATSLQGISDSVSSRAHNPNNTNKQIINPSQTQQNSLTQNKFINEPPFLEIPQVDKQSSNPQYTKKMSFLTNLTKNTNITPIKKIKNTNKPKNNVDSKHKSIKQSNPRKK